MVGRIDLRSNTTFFLLRDLRLNLKHYSYFFQLEFRSMVYFLSFYPDYSLLTVPDSLRVIRIYTRKPTQPLNGTKVKTYKVDYILKLIKDFILNCEFFARKLRGSSPIFH